MKLGFSQVARSITTATGSFRSSEPNQPSLDHAFFRSCRMVCQDLHRLILGQHVITPLNIY